MHRLFARCGVALAFSGLCAFSSATLGQPLASDPETAVEKALSTFRAAIQEGSYDSLLPTLTSSDQFMIRERLSRQLPLLNVRALDKLFLEAVSRARPDRGAEALAATHVTVLDAQNARVDIAPLLSFRPSIYMANEAGQWKVDLSQTLRRFRQPRPREETVSICRRGIRGIAENADLMETDHFLIFAHTGPAPAQSAAELLEELYRDFQEAFPFDLGNLPPAELVELDDQTAERSDSRPPEEKATPVSPYAPGPDPYMIVFLFSYRETFLEFAALHDPEAERSGGYATPAGYFAAWFNPTLKSTIRHEGTHLLMYRRMHLFGAPSWLSEGMAAAMADPDGAMVADMKLRQFLRKDSDFSLEPLLSKQKISFGTDYELARVLVQFLRVEHQKEWVQLIGAIRRMPRRQPQESRAELLRLLGMSQAQLDEAWKAYVLEFAPTEEGH